MLKRYFDKVSQPLLDRIDICVMAPMLSYRELTRKKKETCDSSAVIRERVSACHKIQSIRYQDEDFVHNSRIPASRLEKYCSLGRKESEYMEKMYVKLSLTARTYHKILRVARTIADLEQKENIEIAHLNEAICYRDADHIFHGSEAEMI